MTFDSSLYRAFAVIALTTAASCSDPVGIKGPSGELWDTQLSATSVHVGDSIEVDLLMSNPTGQTITLVYGSPVTTVEAQQGTTTFAAGFPPPQPDTISLPPGFQRIALRPVMLHVLPAGVYPTLGDGSEWLNLSPGVYGLAACGFVGGISPEGPAFIATCAQNVSFTVMP